MSAYPRGFHLPPAADLDQPEREMPPVAVLPAWLIPALVAVAVDSSSVLGSAAAIVAARGGLAIAGHESLLRIACIAALALLVLGLGSGAYGRPALLYPQPVSLLSRWGRVLLLVCAPAYLILPYGSVSAEGLALLAVLAPTALLAAREALGVIIASAFRRNWLPRRSIMVAARTREEADSLARHLRREPDCRSAGATALFACEPDDLACADLLVVQASGIRREDIAATLRAVRAVPGAAVFVTDGLVPAVATSSTSPLARPRANGGPPGKPANLAGYTVLARKRAPLTTVERRAKRLVDLVIAGSSLLLLAPLMLVLPVMLWLRGAGRPVVFQANWGFSGEKLRIPVFASPPGLEPQDHDPGKQGAWHSLRSLPSLFSVLAGDVSLVGPAPLTEDPSEEDRAVARYAARQGLLPGLAQDDGFPSAPPRSAMLRDGSASPDDPASARARDFVYCDRWSLAVDAGIIASRCASLCITPSGRG